MDRITGSGCEVCRGAVPSGKESSGHTGLCAQVLADALSAERARAHDAINQLDKETAYSGVIKAALDLVALVLHPDKSPDENWTHSTGDLPVMARDLRARVERAEADAKKLTDLIADAIECARQRGIPTTMATTRGGADKSIVTLVADMAHSIIGKSAGLRDYDAAFAKCKAERDAALTRLAKLEAVAAAARVFSAQVHKHAVGAYGEPHDDLDDALAALEGGE